MKNPITRTGWFITPKSEEHLIELCKSMSNASEAQRMMIFTMNYCHFLVQEALEKEEARQEELSVMRDAVSPRKYQLDRYPYSTE